jgi:hypothetical protein
VNTKANLDARAQLLGDFRNRILRLRHRHAVARSDDHGVRVFQHVCGIFRRNFAVLTHFFIRTGRRPIGPETTGDDADERAVHRLHMM